MTFTPHAVRATRCSHRRRRDCEMSSATRTFEFRQDELTPADPGGTMSQASTSLGEASARIQATDLKCRKTPRVRTALPGLRVEPKWLPVFRDTPRSAKALSRGVRRPARLPDPPRPACTVSAPPCALAARR
jgi:hypothetical protein